MNERIKELIEQSGAGDVTPPGFHKYLEKFAELIIGKCIDRIKRVGVLEDIENETNMVIDDVKEYFGVK